MIRKFLIASGDNSPISERIDITPSTTDGTYVFETAYPVSWAMITDADVIVYVSKIYPELATGLEITFWNATPSTPFSVNIVYQ
jgi:hypothetical protein